MSVLCFNIYFILGENPMGLMCQIRSFLERMRKIIRIFLYEGRTNKFPYFTCLYTSNDCRGQILRERKTNISLSISVSSLKLGISKILLLPGRFQQKI